MSVSYNFALEAQRLLGSGQAAQAAQLCEQGLDMYPDYATAYAIQARAYLQMNDIEAAFRSVERGLQRFPTNKALVMLDDDLRPMVLLANEEKQSKEEQQEQRVEPIAPTETSGSSHNEPLLEGRQTVEEVASDNVIETNISLGGDMQGVTPDIDPEILQSDALSNIDDDNDNWEHVSELAEEETEVRLLQELIEQEIAEENLDPEVLESDALSNIDDDNDNWEHVSELAEEEVEVRLLHQEILEQEFAEQEHDPTVDILQSDALSNIDDDNDNWEHVSELAEEETEVRLLQEMIEQEITVQQHEDTTELPKEEPTESSSPTAEKDVLAFDKIRVVDGDTIVVAKELAEKIARHPAPQLRLIETAKLNQRTMRTLRSSNLRLIPGLEYTPLRIESSRKSHRHQPHIPEPPPFPAIRGSRMSSPMMPPFVTHMPAIPDLESSLRQRFDTKPEVATAATTERKLSPLEELAQRLERARIPAASGENDAPVVAPPPVAIEQPMMVSETMAMIYEQQGALDQALKAYRQLAREKPARAEHFEQKASAIQRKLDGGS